MIWVSVLIPQILSWEYLLILLDRNEKHKKEKGKSRRRKFIYGKTGWEAVLYFTLKQKENNDFPIDKEYMIMLPRLFRG